MWAELHEKAFRRLNGSPRVVILDNLRGRARCRHLRSHSQSPLARAFTLRCSGYALPGKRSR